MNLLFKYRAQQWRQHTAPRRLRTSYCSAILSNLLAKLALTPVLSCAGHNDPSTPNVLTLTRRPVKNPPSSAAAASFPTVLPLPTAVASYTAPSVAAAAAVCAPPLSPATTAAGADGAAPLRCLYRQRQRGRLLPMHRLRWTAATTLLQAAAQRVTRNQPRGGLSRARGIAALRQAPG